MDNSEYERFLKQKIELQRMVDQNIEQVRRNGLPELAEAMRLAVDNNDSEELTRLVEISREGVRKVLELRADVDKLGRDIRRSREG
jgi:hypothetical protein